MSFRAVVVVGNEQGKVGVGVGKAGDVITCCKKRSNRWKKTCNYCSINKRKFDSACN